MFILKSNNIKDFPFEEAATLGSKELESWADETVHLTAHNSWMLPQIHGYFGNFTVTKNADGLYDSKALLATNIGSDPWGSGLWRCVTQLKRSSLVKSQNTPAGARYSALVPIILSGIKEAQGIPYSKWSKDFLVHVMGSSLHLAATAEVPTTTRSRTLAIRQQGLTQVSGKTPGASKSPLSTWTLKGIKDTEWGHLPPYTLTMLAQIWVAHPSLRTSNMILDPNDWDSMPPVLIEEDALITPKSSQKYASTKGADTPW